MVSPPEKGFVVLVRYGERELQTRYRQRVFQNLPPDLP